MYATADVRDEFDDALRVIALPWRDLDGRVACSGTISMIRAFKDNARVRVVP